MTKPTAPVPRRSSPHSRISQSRNLDGVEWITCREFAKRCGVTQASVNNWIHHKCAILGRCLPTQLIDHPIRSGASRPILFVPASFVGDILSAAQKSRDQIEYQGETYLSITAAALHATVSEDRIRYWIRTSCPYLAGRKLKPIERIVGNFPKRGRVSRKRFIPARDCHRIAAALDDPTRMVAVSDAAKRLGVHTHVLRRWTKKECPWLPNRRRVNAEMRQSRNASGALTYKLYVSSEDIATVVQARCENQADQELKVNGERCLSRSAAAEYCDVAKPTIYKWHTIGCPWIDGKLEAHRRPTSSRKGHTGAQPALFFPESKLAEIVANRQKHYRPDQSTAVSDSEGDLIEARVRSGSALVESIPKSLEPNGRKSKGGRKRKWDWAVDFFESCREANPNCTAPDVLNELRQKFSRRTPPTSQQFRAAILYRTPKSAATAQETAQETSAENS